MKNSNVLSLFITIKNGLVRISIVVLVFFILSTLVINAYSFEFISKSHGQIFNEVRFLGVFISLILIGINTIKSKDDWLVMVIKMIIILFVIYLIFFSLVSIAFMDMCTYTTTEVLLKHKVNKKKQIVLREFGCGAVDGRSSTTHVFEQNEYLGLLYQFELIDTNKINRQDWLSINN